MKEAPIYPHSGGTLSTAAALADSEPAPTVAEIYEAHADFVWASLQRLGVRHADVPDMAQEVFVVVHRKLGALDPNARLKTWLFGICFKVAAGYRRRAWFRRERATAAIEIPSNHTPEDETVRAQDRERLARVLDALRPERQATFVMYELEGQSCADIAELFGVPVGTVHSRLHLARRDFKKSLERLKAKEGPR